jgi:hypothetical protein
MFLLWCVPPPDPPYRVLVDLYGPRTSSSRGSSGQAAQTLDSWKAGITTTRRTKTVRQKWQELLLSVSGKGPWGGGGGTWGGGGRG